MKKFDKERVLLAVAGPVIALAVAFVLSAIVLIASGKSPVEPYALMFEQLGFSDIQVLIINRRRCTTSPPWRSPSASG